MTVERAEMPTLEQKPANGAAPLKANGAAEGEHEQISPQEIRALASRRGWVPKQFFKGDPANWMPPDQFLEKTENEMPIIKAQLRKTEAQLDEVRAHSRELKGLMKRLVESQSEQRDRAVNEAVAKLKEEMAQAAKEGDDKEVLRLSNKIDKTREDAAKATAKEREEPEAKQPNVPAEDAAIMQRWARDNEWFRDNRRMHAYAKGVWEDLASDPDSGFNEMPLKEQLGRIRKEVKAQFPDKFPASQARREPSAVEGGGGLGRAGGGKTFDDLPLEARQLCDELVAKKVIKSRDAYLKEYKW